jgi:hypothetical protein
LRNSAGSDSESGTLYGSSSAQSSQLDYVSGTTDGGPALHCGTGPDGYLVTAYNAVEVFIFRVDDGGYTELGHATGVYTAGQANRIRRSGGDLIYSKNGSDLFSVSDSTYTGGSPGAFSYAGDLIQDNWTDGASSAAYTLTAEQGSYALTGQATGLRAARRITATQGSYALNGQAVALRMGRASLTAAQGSYALNGQSVTLTGPEVSYSLTMEQGSYAYTGSDAAVDSEINIESGSYALNGNDVALRVGRKTSMAQGSYSLNGQALAIRVARTMTMGQGSYALSGQSVQLTQHDPTPVITMETGSYTLDGRQVALFGPGGSNAYITYRPNDPFGWWRP